MDISVLSFEDLLLLWCHWQELLAPVLARPDLLVTRNVEWANLAFGFEQVPIVIFASVFCTCLPVFECIHHDWAFVLGYKRFRKALAQYGTRLRAGSMPICCIALLLTRIYVSVAWVMVGAQTVHNLSLTFDNLGLLLACSLQQNRYVIMDPRQPQAVSVMFSVSKCSSSKRELCWEFCAG